MGVLVPNPRTYARRDLVAAGAAVWPESGDDNFKKDQKLGLAPLGLPATDAQRALYVEVMKLRACGERETARLVALPIAHALEHGFGVVGPEQFYRALLRLVERDETVGEARLRLGGVVEEAIAYANEQLGAAAISIDRELVSVRAQWSREAPRIKAGEMPVLRPLPQWFAKVLSGILGFPSAVVAEYGMAMTIAAYTLGRKVILVSGPSDIRAHREHFARLVHSDPLLASVWSLLPPAAKAFLFISSLGLMPLIAEEPEHLQPVVNWAKTTGCEGWPKLPGDLEQTLEAHG